MAASNVFDELFRALEKNPAPRWIFGEPVTLGDKQIVPVSEFRVVVELPQSPTPTAEGQPAPAGAALRMEGHPVGFLGEQEGRVVFVPIQPACRDDEPCDQKPCDDTPPWVDDLFRRLDDVRLACSRRPRDPDDDGCRRDRARRDDDDEPRGRRPRRDLDQRD